MTTKELIEILSKFDGNLEVGGCGHFGEILRIDSVEVANTASSGKFVNIDIEDRGQEPD